MLFSRKKSDISVEDLVRTAQKGDTEAFGKIYDSFVDQVYRFVFFKVGSKETAEDLTQTIFMKAFERIHSFRNEGNFVSWLFAIARNTIVDHYRKVEKKVRLDDIAEPVAKDDSQEFENRDLLEKTLEKLKELSDEEKEVISLSCVEEYSFKEIASIMERSEGSLRILKFRALKKLKTGLNL